MELKKVALLLFLAGPVLASMDMSVVVAAYDTGVLGGKVFPQTPIFVADRTTLYRLTGLATIINPGTSGSICYNVFWVDGDTGVPINNGPGCASVTMQGYGPNWVYTFYAQKGTPISINTTLNGVLGAPTYNLHFRLEQF